MAAIWDAFMAFNINGAAYLYYTISNNLWYLLIAASAVSCIILDLREQIVETVHEEQQVV